MRLIAAAFLATLLVPVLASSSTPLTLEFALAGIQGGLERSPGHYIAAVVETVAPAEYDEPNGDLWRREKLLQILARKGTHAAEGSEIRLLGDGPVGATYLVFAVPRTTRPEIYGATLLSGDSSETGQRVFREALRRAGLVDLCAGRVGP